MINKPSIDELTEIVGDRYTLCTLCSKRARQIIEHNISLNLDEKGEKGMKAITEASFEIHEGKVIAERD